MPEFFDTHTHLLDAAFDPDREAVIERSRLACVRRIVEVADSPAGWPKAIALSRACPAVRASLGLHPYHAREFEERLLLGLERSIRLPEVVAVGEVGLDYGPHNTATPHDVQQRALERLLTAAKEWDKPVVIHCRNAYEDLLGILRKTYTGPPPAGRYWGVVHCFSGTPEQASACAALGFAIGADGPVTYPKNELLRQAFARVGPAATVLETDCPYLPPQSIRGKRNEPSAVLEVARGLAEVWKLGIEEAARVTTANALDLFRLA
ncbi:MAG: TatD family hydrolase [Elusimicrobia bacterium]|nr:TatD family hydrolase [Elusimicrobiota bacterium]